MRARKNWSRSAGLVLHVLIGGMLIATGLQKIFGSGPPAPLVKYGLAEYTRLIGAGACLTAVLLLVPRTAALGLLVASAFWGGAICIHMAHGEPYVFQVAMLVLTWAGAYLRNPAAPGPVPGSPGPAPAVELNAGDSFHQIQVLFGGSSWSSARVAPASVKELHKREGRFVYLPRL
jgi:hypothetical protein